VVGASTLRKGTTARKRDSNLFDPNELFSTNKDFSIDENRRKIEYFER